MVFKKKKIEQSGGPLAALVNGQYYLTGVVQTGTSTGGSQAICGAPGSYGVYVSVRSLNTWITDAMNESPAAGKLGGKEGKSLFVFLSEKQEQ